MTTTSTPPVLLYRSSSCEKGSRAANHMLMGAKGLHKWCNNLTQGTDSNVLYFVQSCLDSYCTSREPNQWTGDRVMVTAVFQEELTTILCFELLSDCYSINTSPKTSLAFSTCSKFLSGV